MFLRKKKYGALVDSAFEGDALLTNGDLLYETQHPNERESEIPERRKWEEKWMTRIF